MHHDLEVQSWDPEVFSTMAVFLFSLFNLWFYTTDTAKSFGVDTQLLQNTFWVVKRRCEALSGAGKCKLLHES